LSNENAQLLPERQQRSSSGWAETFSLKCICKYGALAIFIGIISFLLSRDFVLDAIVQMKDWFVNAESLGIFLYVVIFYVWAMVFLPTTAIELLGGFIYKWWGLIIVFVPKVSAALSSFFLARNFEKCREMLPKDSLILGLREAIRDNPWKVNAMIRGAYMPFWLKNYGLGAIPETKFFHFSTCLVIIDFALTFVSVYIGLTGDDLIAVLKNKKSLSPAQWVAFVVVGIITVLFVVVMFYYTRKINLQLATQAENDVGQLLDHPQEHTRNEIKRSHHI